jgi:hypothetical protein
VKSHSLPLVIIGLYEFEFRCSAASQTLADASLFRGLRCGCRK